MCSVSRPFGQGRRVPASSQHLTDEGNQWQDLGDSFSQAWDRMLFISWHLDEVNELALHRQVPVRAVLDARCKLSLHAGAARPKQGALPPGTYCEICLGGGQVIICDGCSRGTRPLSKVLCPRWMEMPCVPLQLSKPALMQLDVYLGAPLTLYHVALVENDALPAYQATMGAACRWGTRRCLLLGIAGNTAALTSRPTAPPSSREQGPTSSLPWLQWMTEALRERKSKIKDRRPGKAPTVVLVVVPAGREGVAGKVGSWRMIALYAHTSTTRQKISATR